MGMSISKRYAFLRFPCFDRRCTGSVKDGWRGAKLMALLLYRYALCKPASQPPQLKESSVRQWKVAYLAVRADIVVIYSYIYIHVPACDLRAHYWRAQHRNGTGGVVGRTCLELYILVLCHPVRCHPPPTS